MPLCLMPCTTYLVRGAARRRWRTRSPHLVGLPEARVAAYHHIRVRRRRDRRGEDHGLDRGKDHHYGRGEAHDNYGRGQADERDKGHRDHAVRRAELQSIQSTMLPAQPTVAGANPKGYWSFHTLQKSHVPVNATTVVSVPLGKLYLSRS